MEKITKKKIKKKKNALSENKKKEINPTRYGDWEKKGRCIDF